TNARFGLIGPTTSFSTIPVDTSRKPLYGLLPTFSYAVDVDYRINIHTGDGWTVRGSYNRPGESPPSVPPKEVTVRRHLAAANTYYTRPPASETGCLATNIEENARSGEAP
ncbi:unnamed protein product, partial [Ectocarpus sp. 8 AP-2014]